MCTAYRAEERVDVRQRLHALWLLRGGERRLGEVAAMLGGDYWSVQRWMAWYRRGSLEEVPSHHAGGYGQTPRLTENEQEQVAREVETGRFRNAAAIRAWVARTFGVTYTEGGVYSLLERLRRKPKVPRPAHEKANLAEQEAWKRGDLRRCCRLPVSARSGPLARPTRCGLV